MEAAAAQQAALDVEAQFSGNPVQAVSSSAWAHNVQRTTLEQAASVCERMRPHGGRAFTEGQSAAFNALTDAAKNIRALKPSMPMDEQTIRLEERERAVKLLDRNLSRVEVRNAILDPTC